MTQAVKWYRRAAELGNDMAQYSMGLRYRNGEGVEKNAAKAYEWFEKAAKQGHSAAHLLIGRAFAYGHGVERDFVRAYAWNEVGAKLAKPDWQRKDASTQRELYAGVMTPAQIAEAKRLADELFENHRRK